MSKKDPVSVNIVESQVIELLERYKKLKEENVQLKQDLETALTNLDDAKLEIIKLQTNYNRLKLAKAYGWDEKSKREANLRISQLVRDIDKCLGLLNSID
ncbi:MAG: hypothetical protein J6A44_05030 [Paludibacteraceae bacterium]|nr:hypothetical protein [Paludibacteraceae bacterium]MBO5346248.1 hypothetical protein [Paludibacteraceae bacterium]